MPDKNFNRTANATPQQHGNTTMLDKWGPHITACGYTAVPDTLLANMAQLGLHPPDFVVLVHLLRHWWSADQLPYPSKAKLARDIGTGEKNVQRIIGRLVKLGLVRRIVRKRTGDRNDSNMYDFKPLIERLKPLAVPANPPPPPSSLQRPFGRVWTPQRSATRSDYPPEPRPPRPTVEKI